MPTAESLDEDCLPPTTKVSADLFNIHQITSNQFRT